MQLSRNIQNTPNGGQEERAHNTEDVGQFLIGQRFNLFVFIDFDDIQELLCRCSDLNFERNGPAVNIPTITGLAFFVISLDGVFGSFDLAFRFLVCSVGDIPEGSWGPEAGLPRMLV